jgi:hypothetical protein
VEWRAVLWEVEGVAMKDSKATAKLLIPLAVACEVD